MVVLEIIWGDNVVSQLWPNMKLTTLQNSVILLYKMKFMFSGGEQLFNTAKKTRSDYCNELASLICISTLVPEHVTVY